MIYKTVHFKDANTVITFNHIITKYPFDVDIVSGRRVIDAKSMLGLFSLDISKNLTLAINADKKEITSLLENIKEYIV